MTRILVIFISLLLVNVGTVNAITYTFDTLQQDSYYSDADFSNLFPGVSFYNEPSDGFYVWGTSQLQPDFSGMAIIPAWYDTPESATIAVFDVPTDFVSVTMGDAGSLNEVPDADELYLKAYDSADNLVNSSDLVIDATSNAGHTLTVTSPIVNIAKVKFYGIGHKNNSVLWDNFTFDLATLSVDVDAFPQDCENILDVGAGRLPIAIHGTVALDVNQIDIASIRLWGVPAFRSALEDLGGPDDCGSSQPDGLTDLSLQFKCRDVVKALEIMRGQKLRDGDVVSLTVSGNFLDGTIQIIGGDTAIIKKTGEKSKGGGKPDKPPKPPKKNESQEALSLISGTSGVSTFQE